jgi:hypothetical protein
VTFKKNQTKERLKGEKNKFTVHKKFLEFFELNFGERKQAQP